MRDNNYEIFHESTKLKDHLKKVGKSFTRFKLQNLNVKLNFLPALEDQTHLLERHPESETKWSFIGVSCMRSAMCKILMAYAAKALSPIGACFRQRPTRTSLAYVQPATSNFSNFSFYREKTKFTIL